MIWNIIAMLKFLCPFEGASVLPGKNQTDGALQAANMEELAGSTLSVFDVEILSLLILQLVYLSAT